MGCLDATLKVLLIIILLFIVMALINAIFPVSVVIVE